MALIGSITNYGSLTGEINNFNGSLTGYISSSQLMGGEVVGMRGLKGDAATITVGSTTTGDAGTSASVVNSGTQNDAILDFTIPKGDKGDTGNAATIEVGSTTTGNAGTPASVTNSGTEYAAVFDFTIPKGDKGDTGDAATVSVGTTTTGDAGTSASVTNSGTQHAAVFNFTIPKGDKGDTGSTGAAATIAVGSVTTGDPDDPATVTNSGTSSAAVFDFTIPKGDKGDQGNPGVVSDVEVNGTSVLSGSVAEVTVPVTDVEVNGTSVLNAGVAEVTVPTKTSDLNNDSLFPRGNKATFYGTCATAGATKTVTCADFTSADLTAGVTIVVSFSVANTGAVADLTLDVNSTGAYHIKYNSAGTIANLGDKSYLKASTYMFYFDGTYWIITGYDTNSNTIGYTIRTNGLALPVKTACYRYRICFTSPDGTMYIPANASTSTSATASKTVTTEKIDPFGRIIYYSTTTAISANGTIGASYQMQQYNGVTLGYSFNTTGAALTMTANKAVYVKCTPQTDGSAIIDGTTPFVQDLPTTEDGKIYIFLGIATAATTIEFTLEHPVYCYKDGYVRQWTNANASGGGITYCTCSDSASTQNKTATIVNGSLNTLTSGATVAVKFDYQNTASSPTLKVGTTDAKPIMRYGTTSAGQNVNESWNAGSIVLLVYDGTNWIITDFLNTTYSGGTSAGITTGTDNLNYIWSPKQIHDGIDGMGTSTPTASKISKFDSSAKMNSTDMSSADVSTFVAGLNTGVSDYIQRSELGDYVVEQGIDGNWVYRKWYSGIAECWGEFDKSVTVNNAWGNGYVSVAQSTNFPSGLFTQTPIIQYNSRSSGASGAIIDSSGTDKDTCYYQVFRTSSLGTANTFHINIYAIGTWK